MLAIIIELLPELNFPSPELPKRVIPSLTPIVYSL